jgi:hypothetical protein
MMGFRATIAQLDLAHWLWIGLHINDVLTGGPGNFDKESTVIDRISWIVVPQRWHHNRDER